MQVRVALVDETGIATGRLFGWLNGDSSLAVVGAVALSPDPSGAETMGALEIIDITLNHIEGIAALLMAFDAWRKAQVAAPAARFSFKNIEILANDSSPETMSAVERAMRAAWEEQGDAP